ncbi:outer envelope pore protein 21, chloroplastic-like isoform X1 [Cucurbita maxima]|uniref:Outer envelope pore protein 21, chloroplastic-like isoform X1 n=1 Tax=Cucurbita maxima TaxID=3661 RepID=A0A6J1KSM1_CUCMA|nr:outer envelope pore protein 21, chloroplastic-like isoform X1 [Cucurbita maxima]
METSLRCGGDSRALRIHAKEKIPLDSNIFLQVHGELDTRMGEPSLLAASVRQFFPDLFASAGIGVQYDKYRKLQHFARGKMSFPVTTDGMLQFTIKGQSHHDKDFKQTNFKGAAEFSLGVYNVQGEQDVRVKVGFEVFEKIPYLQIRENNWTLNADINGRWSVRFIL